MKNSGNAEKKEEFEDQFEENVELIEGNNPTGSYSKLLDEYRRHISNQMLLVEQESSNKQEEIRNFTNAAIEYYRLAKTYQALGEL